MGMAQDSLSATRASALRDKDFDALCADRLIAHVQFARELLKASVDNPSISTGLMWHLKAATTLMRSRKSVWVQLPHTLFLDSPH